ncbi:hypothetical protein SAMN02745119_03268 [Trichlorobacter thiogenes]|uniref:Polyketide cyclase / dehydrase and lipid transport n=1 Tax=Trichlorobacter thiogenes TaxID=115783 RepID=A0A1T4S504_9BACT|nr:SRPBCC family protein [Trichlorobacter thiogenes]SKA23380.1 hypothetical protein SAMN02745119_03268 [Trichlorobacter thiogenes]
MKRFDVKGVELQVDMKRAFAYIADPTNLPQWTSAFASVTKSGAVLRTPNGEVEIGLSVPSSEEQGTIDWIMTFPDGSVASAFSRLVPIDSKSCVFTFVLTLPPVPLEQLEGALEAQAQTLTEELNKLKELLEHEA